jgi:apyrase
VTPAVYQTLIILMMAWFMIPPPRPVLVDGDAATKSNAATLAAAGGSGQTVYNIQLDAGSTGSRIHVFKFTKAGQELKLISDTFMQLKPGLSSYRDEPDKAAASLKPLLDKALATVPKDLHVGLQPAAASHVMCAACPSQ